MSRGWRWLIPSGVNRNHSALFKWKTLVFCLEAELLPLQRKLNLPNIIRWKEYMCIILTTKQWHREEGSCRLLLWATVALMLFEWEVSVHLQMRWHFQLFVPGKEAPWEACGWMHSPLRAANEVKSIYWWRVWGEAGARERKGHMVCGNELT